MATADPRPRDGSRHRRAAPRSGRAAALGLVALITLAGCEQSIERTSLTRSPVLALVSPAPGTVELTVAGPYGLRALQAKLAYDDGAARLTKLEVGADAKRLDRVFFTDLAKAAGSLTVGLTDTRRVLLPARGSLLRLELEGKAGAERATVRVLEPLGAIDGGERVDLAETSLEVKLR